MHNAVTQLKFLGYEHRNGLSLTTSCLRMASAGNPSTRLKPIASEPERKNAEPTNEEGVGEDDKLRESRGLRKLSTPLKLMFTSTSATSLAMTGRIAETGNHINAVTQLKFLGYKCRNKQPKVGCRCWVRGMVVVRRKGGREVLMGRSDDDELRVCRGETGDLCE